MAIGPVTTVLEEAPAYVRQRPGGRFLVIKGPDRGEQVSLFTGQITIGSAPSCELVLSDKAVSRRHATATLEGESVVVRDLGSTNGSFIHGSRFREIEISFGTELTLGKTVIKFLPDEEVLEPEELQVDSYGQLVGGDTRMRRLFTLLNDVAPSDATVLIEGETGTGKELIAEELHYHSRRATGPYIVFDCGAVPGDLIESELFGHVTGAFTGAVADRKGAFAEAHGGTIFLDEIGELPLEMQPSLLRALDKRMVRRVGASQYEKIDVRVIAATNRNLREEVATKAFREDLYFRLAVIRLTVPPLRDRGHDIDRLIDHFIAHFQRLLPGDKKLRITDQDRARLHRYSWPGNVRELRNIIERACVLAKGETLDLHDTVVAEADTAPPLNVRTDLPFKEAKGQLVEHFEREYIVDLLKRHRMNLSAASREARMDRKHLRELSRKYGLDVRADDGNEGGGDAD